MGGVRDDGRARCLGWSGRIYRPLHDGPRLLPCSPHYFPQSLAYLSSLHLGLSSLLASEQQGLERGAS